MFDWLKKRLAEPSSYAGVAAVIAGAGEAAEAGGAVYGLGMLLAGVLAMTMREKAD